MIYHTKNDIYHARIYTQYPTPAHMKKTKIAPDVVEMTLDISRAVYFRLEVYARRMAKNGIDMPPEQVASQFLTHEVEKKILLTHEQWQELQDTMRRELKNTRQHHTTQHAACMLPAKTEQGTCNG